MMMISLGGKTCGKTNGSCIDVPSEPMSTETIIILVIVGVLTFIVILVGIIYSCYYRRRQLEQQRLHLSSVFDVQNQWQLTSQPIRVFDGRASYFRDQRPTY